MSKPAARVRDSAECSRCSQPPYCSSGYIISGARYTFINNRLAANLRSNIYCCDYSKMVQGSRTVFIENQPAVRLGDLHKCGKITSASPNVFIG